MLSLCISLPRVQQHIRARLSLLVPTLSMMNDEYDNDDNNNNDNDKKEKKNDDKWGSCTRVCDVKLGAY
jgi:hypothetical protein